MQTNEILLKTYSRQLWQLIQPFMPLGSYSLTLALQRHILLICRRNMHLPTLSTFTCFTRICTVPALPAWAWSKPMIAAQSGRYDVAYKDYMLNQRNCDNA